ncbi:hypothetical protein SISNIDRAFT_486471 [Sistotremastrum niveocremeum HHB9708]|uniref:Galactose oxidase n=1 Tax=Sistotremastrum niveocremeum HHB9708 TaxID=1314777 RepID=A0A164TKC7_9AGAM|nr:hypothetical protein SISNIDRAFT_486471 [Sistotremastrum niveocremeum HHB9708]
MRRNLVITSFLAYLLIGSTCGQSNYTPVPRWGSASALLSNTLLVHGGRTNPSNEYTYNGQVTNDLLSLDISLAFNVSSPNWRYLSGSLNLTTSQGPAVAFHTLTPYSSTGLLSFGGDGGPPQALSTRADSASLLDISVPQQSQWTLEPQGWASEPIRREYHTAAASRGGIWIVGGEKVDGSGLLADNYVFSIEPIFSTIPSLNGPPPLSGHAAVVLSSGVVMIFGGVSPSQGGLQGLDTFYVLDTAAQPPSWSTWNATGDVPAPRRNFAAVVLDGDKILIQGGVSDAGSTPQSFLSDGAVLDTKQNPMVWTSVPALTLVEGRIDQVAFAVGTSVFFCFGWGSQGAFPSSLLLFDTVDQTFQSSWTPPASPIPASSTVPPASEPATAPGTYNPTPTSTSGSQSGSNTSGSSTNTGSQSASNSSPASQTSSVNSSTSPSSTILPAPNVTGIALGSVFGVIALVALTGGATYWVIKKREERDGGAFSLMRDADDDGNSPHGLGGSEKVRMAGSHWVGGKKSPWGILSAFGARGPMTQRRMDMLADEDARVFDIESLENSEMGHRPRGPGRQWSGGSSISNWYGQSGRKLSEMVGGSLNSLRAVGGMLSQSRRDPGAPESDWWKNKEIVPLDPFGDDMALRDTESSGPGPTALSMQNVSGIAAVGVSRAARPRGGMPSGSLSYPYTDPTSERAVAEVIHDARTPEDEDGPGRGEQQPMLDRSVPSLAIVTVQSRSSDEKSASVSSRDRFSNVAEVSHSSHEGPSSPAPARPLSTSSTSIIGAHSAPSLPLRRSDSWWARFSRTPFREKRLSSPPQSPRQSAADALIDIRDPNPAPRLVPIQESAHTSPESAHQKAGYERNPSLSSLHTTKTADSHALEQLGANMDVVQRANTLSSYTTSPSTAGESPRNDTPWAQAGERSIGAMMQSPLEEEHSAHSHSPDHSSDTESRRDPELPSTQRPPPTAGSSIVASRIQAWERRLSQDDLTENPRRIPARDRRSVNYGLAARPSLFIANPDRHPSDASDA